MVKTLQMSGLPGSFRVTRAGSVAAGLSFSQMVSGESKRAIVLPRLFDILAWPSSPRTRFAVESRACGSGSERSEEHTSELQSQSNLVCRPLLEKKQIID